MMRLLVLMRLLARCSSAADVGLTNPTTASKCESLDQESLDDDAVDECYKKLAMQDNIACSDRTVAMLWLAESSGYQEKRALLHEAVKVCPTSLTPRLQVCATKPNRHTVI
jgi:hypothetical protein